MREPSAYGLPSPLPRKGIYRVLVCRPNHRLGNTLLITPLIAEIERHFKGAEVDVVSEGDIAQEVFGSYFSVRSVHCLPKRGFKHPVKFLRTIARIRRTHYDLIIDPCLGSGFSRAMTRLLKGTYKLGFSDQPEGSGLTQAAPSEVAMRHMARRPVNLLRWALGQQIPPEECYPVLDIRLSEPELRQGRLTISELVPTFEQNTSPVIGIFANATGAKRYPIEWWRELIDTIKTLSPTAAIVEMVPMHGHSMLGSEWPAYYSSDIRRMGAVMAGLDLLISADCGVMHLAAASQVTTVGLFKVTDASVYEPYGNGSTALSTQDLSAREVACRVVAAYSGLLAGPDATAADGQTSSIYPFQPRPEAMTR